MAGNGAPGGGGPKRTQEGAEWEMFRNWMENFFKKRTGKGLFDDFTIDEIMNHPATPQNASRDALEKKIQEAHDSGLIAKTKDGYRVTSDGGLVFGDEPLDL